jgi:exodeoxyribonuclease X
VVASGKDWGIKAPFSALYRPLGEIPAETKAVHHLTEADFNETMPVCTPLNLGFALSQPSPADVLIAHNCAFERSFISDDVTGGIPWICTQKCALRLWPDAPKHSNQVLRYWRGMILDATQAMPPHRAGPDAWVTAHLLKDMLGEATVEQLINWTTEPKLLLRVPFGKHRNLPWSEVPTDYLSWMAKQTDMDTDVLWNARQELYRR